MQFPQNCKKDLGAFCQGPIDDLTGDGTCIIELFSTEVGGSDSWTPSQFEQSVYRLLTKCLFWGEHEGGIGRGLGQPPLGNKRSTRSDYRQTDGLAGRRGLLSMVIERYVPHVECADTKETSVLFPCQSALDQMPASAFQQIFGAQGTPFIDVALPVKYSDRQYKPCASCYRPTRQLIKSTDDTACTIEVSMIGPPVLANWYSIWGSAESIVAMCVRSRKDGVSLGRCMHSLFSHTCW